MKFLAKGKVFPRSLPKWLLFRCAIFTHWCNLTTRVWMKKKTHTLFADDLWDMVHFMNPYQIILPNFVLEPFWFETSGFVSMTPNIYWCNWVNQNCLATSVNVLNASFFHMQLWNECTWKKTRKKNQKNGSGKENSIQYDKKNWWILLFFSSLLFCRLACCLNPISLLKQNQICSRRSSSIVHCYMV